MPHISPCRPRDSDFYVYTDAVKSLNAGLAFSEADRSTQQTVRLSSLSLEGALITSLKARLAETGAKKIAQVFTQLVAGACASAILEPTQYLGALPSEVPLMSRDTEESLTPVVASLQSLPVPVTHPSHPASVGNLNVLNEAQDGYAAMRSGWAKRCLEPMSRDLIAAAEDPGNGIQTSIELAQWIEGFLLLAEVSKSVSRMLVIC